MCDGNRKRKDFFTYEQLCSVSKVDAGLNTKKYLKHFLLKVFAMFYQKFCRKILRTFTESLKFLNCGTGKVLLFSSPAADPVVGLL